MNSGPRKEFDTWSADSIGIRGSWFLRVSRKSEERPFDKAVDSGASGIVDAVELNRKAQPLVLAAVNSDDAATGLRRLGVIREVECQFYHRAFGNRSLRLYEAAGCCEVCGYREKGLAAEQAGDLCAKRRS